jgi:hypothetical protein|tara:strand:- start:63 stop:1217 length:1155 start_codon:yes stop_codon:yes gene_type:complete
MVNYAFINPGKFHSGFQFLGPPFHHREYIEELEPYKNVKFKTAVLHNRRVYVGNVKVTTNAGVIETLGDTMLKSEPNQFDRFTMRGRIDVTSGDGEDIIKLESYADRILQFKHSTLHVINATEKGEFLEDSYKFKGVVNPQAVARTDYGIAWANKFGCFIYDGRQIHDLLEDGIKRKIKQSTWDSFVTASTMVGYSPSKRQIIVVDGHTDDDTGANIFLYDIPTRAWVKGLGRVNNDDKSNFAVIPTADRTSSQLCFLKKDSSDVKLVPWSDTSAVGAIDLRMRDEDFGEPHIRKKISKIYVTSKRGSGITVSGATNGSQNFSDITFDVGTISVDQTVWTKTEHKVTAGGNNVYSVQLKFSGTAANANFEINDISVVYRLKGVK